MRTSPVIAPRRRAGAVALAVSSVLVIVVACVFDLLAGQQPNHTVPLVVAAAAVGIVRWLLRGRLRGFFTLVNLAVVAQPVAHGVGTLTRTTAGLVPHSHVVPEHIIGLLVQVLAALLVVVVAGSEPIVVFVASAARALAVSLLPGSVPASATPHRVVAADTDLLGLRADAVARCGPRRGPPSVVGLTG